MVNQNNKRQIRGDYIVDITNGYNELKGLRMNLSAFLDETVNKVKAGTKAVIKSQRYRQRFRPRI